MKNPNLATLLVFLLSPIFLTAQAPPIQWQKTIGGANGDWLHSIHQLGDGGYILGGYSVSNISGDKADDSHGLDDMWILKLDANGSIIWQKTIGGSEIDQLSTLNETSDNGYIMGGYSESNISGDKTEDNSGLSDYWVIKLDSVGNIEWQNTIGGHGYDVLSEVQETSDGGYILGGRSESPMSGDKTEISQGSSDYWVVKLDITGAIQWQNTIGGNDYDFFTLLQQTSDDGYIVGGFTKSNISGDKTENSHGKEDFWILKLDTIGNIQWQKTIGGSEYDRLNTLIQTADGGYILGGESLSGISGDKTEDSTGAYDYWVVKLDGLGAIQWQNTIGGADYDYLTTIIQTTDYGYLIGGYSLSNISGDKSEDSKGYGDYWVLKLNSVGGIQWQKTIGGASEDRLYSLQQTNVDSYILGGFSSSNISGDKAEDSRGGYDFWVIKLEETTQTTNANSTKVSFFASPNPISDYLLLKLGEPARTDYSVQINDMSGKIVYQSSFPSGAQLLEMQTIDWNTGIYDVQLRNLSSNEIQVMRVVKVYK